MALPEPADMYQQNYTSLNKLSLFNQHFLLLTTGNFKRQIGVPELHAAVTQLGKLGISDAGTAMPHVVAERPTTVAAGARYIGTHHTCNPTILSVKYTWKNLAQTPQRLEWTGYNRGTCS